MQILPLGEAKYDQSGRTMKKQLTLHQDDYPTINHGNMTMEHQNVQQQISWPCREFYRSVLLKSLSFAWGDLVLAASKSFTEEAFHNELWSSLTAQALEAEDVGCFCLPKK